MTRPDWITFTINCCEHYKVPPFKALGVAFAESSLPGVTHFRFGLVGKYWLPWGVYCGFIRKWPINDIYVQTEVAVRAIAHWTRKCGSFERAMYKYNASCDRAYLARVREGEMMFREILGCGL